MPKLNKEDFEKLIGSVETLQEDINEYVKFYNELYKDTDMAINTKHIPTDFQGFDSYEVSFGGEEYWGYGGHESHSFEVRNLWWTDHESYKAKLVTNAETYRVRLISKAEKQAENDRRVKLAQFESLKKELGVEA